MNWVLFLLWNANVVSNTCYQNSGYIDKVCSNQKGIILFIVVMMQRQGSAVTCQPMNYKWILSWKGDSSSGVAHTHLNRMCAPTFENFYLWSFKKRIATKEVLQSGGTRVLLHSHQTTFPLLCTTLQVTGVENTSLLGTLCPSCSHEKFYIFNSSNEFVSPQPISTDSLIMSDRLTPHCACGLFIIPRYKYRNRKGQGQAWHWC